MSRGAEPSRGFAAQRRKRAGRGYMLPLPKPAFGPCGTRAAFAATHVAAPLPEQNRRSRATPPLRKAESFYPLLALRMESAALLWIQPTKATPCSNFAVSRGISL